MQNQIILSGHVGLELFSQYHVNYHNRESNTDIVVPKTTKIHTKS